MSLYQLYTGTILKTGIPRGRLQSMGNQNPIQTPPQFQSHNKQDYKDYKNPLTNQNAYPYHHTKPHLSYPPVLDVPPQTSHIKTQQMPQMPQMPQVPEQTRASRIVSQIQQPMNPLQGSRLTSNLQPSVMGNNTFESKGSYIGHHNLTPMKQKEIPDIQLIIKPQISKHGSILEKNPNLKKEKALRFDGYTEQIDDLRLILRSCQNRMTNTLIPDFSSDILAMNSVIESERLLKLKDKNKVLFLLKQKHHYHKLCLRMKEFSDKIKSILFDLRKKDSMHKVSSQEIMIANQVKQSIEAFVNNIETDLPKKGWRNLIDKPTNKYYLSVVHSAIQDAETMRKYNDLEQSLTNPQILEQINNEEMMHSTTRRVGTETTQEQAKKLIQGPSNYPSRNNELMKSARFPS